MILNIDKYKPLKLVPIDESERTSKWVEANWWTEKNFTFNGIPGTYYEWPVDRIISFDIVETGKNILVPIQNMQNDYFDSLGNVLNWHIENYKRARKETKEPETPYIHLARYKDTSYFGCLVWDYKMNISNNMIDSCLDQQRLDSEFIQQNLASIGLS